MDKWKKEKAQYKYIHIMAAMTMIANTDIAVLGAGTVLHVLHICI